MGIICPNCQTENFENSKFCLECGTALANLAGNDTTVLEVPAFFELVHMTTGVSYGLKDNKISFGRNMTSDVVLDTDRFTSREHAKITKEGDDYIVTDLGSTNGTYLNGRKLIEPVKLNRGDIIRIGSNEFICNFN